MILNIRRMKDSDIENVYSIEQMFILPPGVKTY